ncbi:MAG TPA: MauE/DoxX family redox-associated membrane protein [Candidatus Acidoferrum sp.]|nr:MauE/DoxX family redox-associated membrane protein [Candidatus Acidoferrum sp.]
MQSSPLNFRRAVIWLGRLLIGGIFVYAGYAKLVYPNHNLWPWFMLKFSVAANLSTFAFQVESYKILSASASSFVAHTLPYAEIVLGLLLLIGWKFRVWATIASAILVGFLAVVTRAYLLHMDINCGCFGTPEPLTIMTVLRDSALVLLAVLMTVFAYQEARGPHPWAAAPEKA